ncbi:MAG TPA: MMPL family transporter [Candidatus Saccharimonadaceae bacterium]|jgi:putative drug exporter of the RND superfamily|nr:MMPL family transporter [Candidatus Saccharimonadaceae bacterium]
MANFIKRLGLFSFKHKWLTLSAWLILVSAVIGLMLAFQQPASNNISIPGTEAQTTIEKAEKLFPNAGGGMGRIVFEVPSGKTIDDYKAAISQTLAEAAKAKDVEQVISPFVFDEAVSEDRRIAFAQLQLSVSRNNVTDQTAEEVASSLSSARAAGVTTEAGGDIVRLAPEEILGIGEVIGVLVAAIVLIVMFKTVFAAGVPLMVAIFSLAVGVGSVFALSGLVEINATTPVLAVMLGLAVGIDYSLFILSRYRNYVLEGDDFETAIASAIGTAGNAVVFAALTVVIALSALSVIQIPLLTTMGLAAAGTVAIAAVAAITLLPAFAGIIGGRILSRKQRASYNASKVHHELHISHSSAWYKLGNFISRKPLPIIIGAVILLVALTYPVTDLRLGLPTDEYAASDTTQRKAYDILSRGFGEGFNGPLIVLAENIETPSSQEIEQTKLALMSGQLKLPPAAQQMTAGSMQDPDAAARLIASYSKVQQIAAQLGKQSGVARAIPASVAPSGKEALIQVIPTSGPSDEATVDLIKQLRNDDNVLNGSEIELSVTGTTAIQTDIDQKMLEALPPYLGITVGLSFLILLVAFRSILVPLKATIGFLLSVGAMFGALVVMFQWGAFGLFDPTPIISFLPIIGLGILFGLAMDYEFFMNSSIRESYVHNRNAKQSVNDGFSLGAKVVTAAAIIMVSVFGGFMFSHDDIIKQVGFGLAFGILVDAFLVRMIIGPAVLSMIGDKAWYLPRWLSRIIPRISIEGKE